MKVRVYASDQTGSGRYRCLLPAQAAKAAGADVTVAPFPEQQPGRPPLRPLPIERHPVNPTFVRAIDIDADVIVFQRPVEEELARVVIPQLQAAGKAVVVEIDDDLTRIDPRHMAHAALNPRRNPTVNSRFLQDACQMADLVTVTTPALAARYGKHGRVAVLPNCVPEHLLTLPRSSDGHTIGWRGWTRTHPGDLRSTHGGVQDTLARTGARFLQIGPAEGVRADLSLADEPEATGPLGNIDDFYAAIGRLDVGIVPLADTQFNAAKSYLAGLEYAACGVPFVASPVAEYQRLAGQGVGVLAAYRARNWRARLTDLISDTALRHEAAEHGRAVVAEHHTVERNAHRWIEAWEQALATARRRPLPAAA